MTLQSSCEQLSIVRDYSVSDLTEIDYKWYCKKSMEMCVRACTCGSVVCENFHKVIYRSEVFIFKILNIPILV